MSGQEPVNAATPYGLIERRAFQERFWHAQRVAWVVFALFILAALAGLTGNGGPLSEREASDALGSRYSYSVISRSEGRDLLIADIPARDGRASLFLSHDFLDLYTVLNVQPLPTDSLDSGAGSTLFVPATPGTTATLRLELEPRRPGLHRVAIGSNEDTRITYRVLVLP